MATRWFADPPAGRVPDETVARLVGEVERLLERLRPPALAPGEARVDPEAGAAGAALLAVAAAEPPLSRRTPAPAPA